MRNKKYVSHYVYTGCLIRDGGLKTFDRFQASTIGAKFHRRYGLLRQDALKLVRSWSKGSVAGQFLIVEK